MFSTIRLQLLFSLWWTFPDSAAFFFRAGCCRMSCHNYHVIRDHWCPIDVTSKSPHDAPTPKTVAFVMTCSFRSSTRVAGRAGGGCGGLTCHRRTSSLGVTSGIIGKESNPNAGENLYLWMQTGWRRPQAKAINSSCSVDSLCVEMTRMMFVIGEKVSIQLLQPSSGGITFDDMFCVKESHLGTPQWEQNCSVGWANNPASSFLSACFFSYARLTRSLLHVHWNIHVRTWHLQVSSSNH